MGGQWRVDPDGLRVALPAFTALARSVDGVIARLAAALDAEGECWGRDRSGTAFARGYLPAAASTRDVLPVVSDGVLAIGDALLLVADDVDAVDIRARRRFG